MMWPRIIIMIFFLMIFRTLAAPKNPVGIFYLGQNRGEGTIASVCATGGYSHIILPSLTNLGSGRVPKLNLTGLCDPTTNYTCNLSISDDIRFCQQLGIIVLLSLDGANGNYSLSSKEEAQNLYNTYLGGRSESRPFGNAVLDGIYFMIDQGSDQYCLDLATYLSSYGEVYLGAVHRCPPPGTSMGRAINSGVFHSVTIQLYTPNSRQCDYNGNISDFTNVWVTLTTMIPAGDIFLGLPAASQSAENGFIPAEVLKTEILPVLGSSHRFGGMMMRYQFWDNMTDYLNEITT